MTTLRQKLVRKKNRKLRRLRELYPDVRIKLFYARDFRALMLKYGRFALAEELSGTPGQVTPPDGPTSRSLAGRPASSATPGPPCRCRSPRRSAVARTDPRRRRPGAVGGASPADDAVGRPATEPAGSDR